MNRDGVVIDLCNPEELAWLSQVRERVGTQTIEYTNSDIEFDPRERVLERYRETMGGLLASKYPLDEFELNSSARETLIKSLMSPQAVDEYQSTDDPTPADKSFESFDVRRVGISRQILKNNDQLLESLFDPGRNISEIESLVESEIVDELGRYQHTQSARLVGKEIANEVTESRYKQLCTSITGDLLSAGMNPKQVLRNRKREFAEMIAKEHPHPDLFDQYFETAYGPMSTTETAIQDLEASPLDSQAMRDRYSATIGHPPPSISDTGARGGTPVASDADSVTSGGNEDTEPLELRPVADAPERDERRLYLVHAATEQRRAVVRKFLLEPTDNLVLPETSTFEDIAGLFPVRQSQVRALDSMRPGDHLLFYTDDDQYGVHAVVGAAIFAPEIGESVWDYDSSPGRPYIIWAENPRRVDINAGELCRRLGYAREYPAGVQPVAPARLDSVRASYESVKSFLSALQAIDQDE